MLAGRGLLRPNVLFGCGQPGVGSDRREHDINTVNIGPLIFSSLSSDRLLVLYLAAESLIAFTCIYLSIYYDTFYLSIMKYLLKN